jgi:hypothetical protein
VKKYKKARIKFDRKKLKVDEIVKKNLILKNISNKNK